MKIVSPIRICPTAVHGAASRDCVVTRPRRITSKVDTACRDAAGSALKRYTDRCNKAQQRYNGLLALLRNKLEGRQSRNAAFAEPGMTSAGTGTEGLGCLLDVLSRRVRAEHHVSSFHPSLTVCHSSATSSFNLVQSDARPDIDSMRRHSVTVMATAALLSLLYGTFTSAQSSSDGFVPSPVSGVLTVSIPPPDVEISRGENDAAQLRTRGGT